MQGGHNKYEGPEEDRRALRLSECGILETDSCWIQQFLVDPGLFFTCGVQRVGLVALKLWPRGHLLILLLCMAWV